MRNPDAVDLDLGDEDGLRFLLRDLGFRRSFGFGFGTFGPSDAEEGKTTRSTSSERVHQLPSYLRYT